MEHLGPVLILAVFGGLLLCILLAMSVVAKVERRKEDLHARRAWEEIAKKLKGRLEGAVGESCVRFAWNGREASLLESPNGTSVFKVPGGPFGSLDLEVQDWGSAREKPPQDMEGFREMKCRGADEQAVRRFLTDPVCQILRDLLRSSGGMTNVRLQGDLRIEGSPRRSLKSLGLFTILCLQLAQHAKLFVEQTSAVSVVETGTSSTGMCQICGAELGGKLVRCSRCSTPHHADCWEYAGNCSTYGCGEKTFVT